MQFDNPIDQTMFENYLLAIEQAEERVWGLEKHLDEVARREPYKQPIEWLSCFRGISVTEELDNRSFHIRYFNIRVSSVAFC